jgi:Rieske Fe-S protein
MLGMDDEEDQKGLSRREWVKIGLAIGGAAAATAGGITLLSPLLRGPGSVRDLTEQIRYTRFPTPQWWNDREGQPIRASDLKVWQGATGVWRPVLSDGKIVHGTGYPVLVIRVKRDDSVFKAPKPDEVSLPAGYGLYYDDPSRDLRIVAFYDRCAHLCCYPGWQVVQDPPPSRDYVSDAPTYRVYGLDPIYCVCHGSQYDPMVLVAEVNPTNGVRYVGPSRVHGPSSRAIPIIPLRVEDDVLLGGMPDPGWYQYC